MNQANQYPNVQIGNLKTTINAGGENLVHIGVLKVTKGEFPWDKLGTIEKVVKAWNLSEYYHHAVEDRTAIYPPVGSINIRSRIPNEELVTATGFTTLQMFFDSANPIPVELSGSRDLKLSNQTQGLVLGHQNMISLKEQSLKAPNVMIPPSALLTKSVIEHQLFVSDPNSSGEIAAALFPVQGEIVQVHSYYKLTALLAALSAYFPSTPILNFNTPSYKEMNEVEGGKIFFAAKIQLGI